jgi:hypothetical protein
MNLYLNQAAQEKFWQTRSLEVFALKLRTSIGIVALALPDVQKSLSEWLK